MAKRGKVVIAYCAECGYEPQTLALADALMRAFAQRLSSIELVPSYDGTFEVSLDGTLLHSMRREGGFPDSAAIVARVREGLAAPAS